MLDGAGTERPGLPDALKKALLRSKSRHPRLLRGIVVKLAPGTIGVEVAVVTVVLCATVASATALAISVRLGTIIMTHCLL